MSLRKTYEQALQNKAAPLTAIDETVTTLVKQVAEAVTRDGDYNARVIDHNDTGFVFEVRGCDSRFARKVSLSSETIWRAYCGANGHEATTVTDLVETLVNRMAQDQLDAQRQRDIKARLGLR